MDAYPRLAILSRKELIQNFRHFPIFYYKQFLLLSNVPFQMFLNLIRYFDFLPLFPILCSDSTPSPFIHCFKKFFHICKSKVFLPSSHVFLVLFFAYCIVNPFMLSISVLFICSLLFRLIEYHL